VICRLDRWLSALGVASRSEAKNLIRAGAVKVSGQVCADAGAGVDTETDTLTVRGEEIDGRLMRHVVLYKPAGILTAARDKKQPTVMDLLPPVYGSIGCMPVGRLDKDTTGILLFTCDGELNHRLLSPGRHVDKVYFASVEGKLTDRDVRAFAEGIDLGEFKAQPAEMEILRAGAAESEARLVLREGKFHQVKRMFSALGHEVKKLHRGAFGPLTLDAGMAPGDWRELTEEELRALKIAAGMEKETES